MSDWKINTVCVLKLDQGSGQIAPYIAAPRIRSDIRGVYDNKLAASSLEIGEALGERVPLAG
ncbi:hypothetical protein HBIAX_03536 [Achromobacter xylosoxidans]|uniref:Uncharacterized protein n=1 Tax=Achromobacter insolitus TaxID=217204 RepID=A0A6S7FFW5_9BURK|nr:hypothetical protein LMG6000_04788 [Achromobacter insolitus]CKI19844.1 Uncharacterised protein [Achromobacter xylosoxidans]CAB3942238.1 hypothetical protein LMG5997_04839 [Achromobacter insolitus]CUJ47115.1 Uncharacterised protein [Achromobacter xylosoxidans]SQG77795.1 Uncharacterised protein [Achromobacter xylosoxidans]